MARRAGGVGGVPKFLAQHSAPIPPPAATGALSTLVNVTLRDGTLITLRDGTTQVVSLQPGVTQDDNTLVATGSVVALTGTLSVTQANQILVSTGGLIVAGVLNATQAEQTLVAAGTVLAAGTLSVTQAAQTLSAAGFNQSITGVLGSADNIVQRDGTLVTQRDSNQAVTRLHTGVTQDSNTLVATGTVAAAATATLLPALVTDADNFFIPAVAATATLLPAAFTDVDAIYAPTAQPGAVTLAPTLVTDADAFFCRRFRCSCYPRWLLMPTRSPRRALRSRRNSWHRALCQRRRGLSWRARARWLGAPGALCRCRHDSGTSGHSWRRHAAASGGQRSGYDLCSELGRKRRPTAGLGCR